jgi:NAD(P)-dependent dehydrogenase (short-subunit alcohol dehydrogenase family)
MNDLKGKWALVLGASSGFGEATSIELARRGMNIAGVHLDRKQTLPNVERITDEIRKLGSEALYFNINAADEARRKDVLDALAGRPVKALLHSLAFGTLKTFLAEKPEEAISKPQLEMTLDVMANSLVYWVQDLWVRKMLAKGSRIFAMTSAGSSRIWSSYGAVSAAKCALESHIRQLAFELAPHGISANAIRAGVTDTPALRKIPGNEEMVRGTLARHPAKRLTTTKEVACMIAALCSDDLDWVSGNTIGVDGGEILI